MKKKQLYFSHRSFEMFDAIYNQFHDAFSSGQILLGGSLYYHLMNMPIFRLPGDLDLIIDANNVNLQKEVSFFIDKVGEGIKVIETARPKHEQIGITRVIHHKNGLRIEISAGDFRDTYFNPVGVYKLYHFHPSVLISNIFLYFQIYISSYSFYRNNGKDLEKFRYLFKIKKMYSNAQIIIDFHGLTPLFIIENHEEVLRSIYDVFNQEEVSYYNFFTHKILKDYEHNHLLDSILLA